MYGDHKGSKSGTYTILYYKISDYIWIQFAITGYSNGSLNLSCMVCEKCLKALRKTLQIK